MRGRLISDSRLRNRVQRSPRATFTHYRKGRQTSSQHAYRMSHELRHRLGIKRCPTVTVSKDRKTLNISDEGDLPIKATSGGADGPCFESWNGSTKDSSNQKWNFCLTPYPDGSSGAEENLIEARLDEVKYHSGSARFGQCLSIDD